MLAHTPEIANKCEIIKIGIPLGTCILDVPVFTPIWCTLPAVDPYDPYDPSDPDDPYDPYDPEPYQPWAAPGTIRSSLTGMCLDLPGGNVQNGQPLWQWECIPGAENQQWHFDDNTWKITSALNPNMCIDAGMMEEGSVLMLWECNGLDQQVFGYDGDMQTIYLANTASKTDATFCFELQDPLTGNSSQIATAVCGGNGAGEQMWQVGDMNSATRQILI